MKAHWRKPLLSEEQAELIRVCDEKEIPIDNLLQAFFFGHRVSLLEREWVTVENTDSVEPLSEAEARAYAKDYGRDYDRIREGLLEGAEMPLPTILREGRELHCVGGNTRLMACRALDIEPEVWLIEVP